MMTDKGKRGKRHKRHSWLHSISTIVAVLMVGSLMACGNRSTDEGNEAQAAPEEVTSQTVVSGEGFTPESTTLLLRDIYYEAYDDWGPKNDGEFVQWYQENAADKLYFSNEWTMEEVVDSYYEHPEIWVTYERAAVLQQICFTPDYRYCFKLAFDDWDGEIKTGWFVVNGVRVAMLDEQTFDSVHPDDLVAKYFSGEWDGNIVRTHDGGVEAYLSGYGALHYSVDSEYYTDEEDPEGLAYTGYADPWWWNKTEQKKYQYKYQYWGVDGWSDYLEEYREEESGIGERFYLNVYPDLPEWFDLMTILLSERSDELGTFVMTKDGVMLFDKGEQVKQWTFDATIAEEIRPEDPFQWDAEGCGLRVCGDKGTEGIFAHVYDGTRILDLRSDGTVEVAVEEIILRNDLMFREKFSWYATQFGLKGDTLVRFNFRTNRDEPELVVIDTGVLSVDFVDMRTFEKADGLYAISKDENRDDIVVYLGQEPKQYYLDYYNMLHRAVLNSF